MSESETKIPPEILAGNELPKPEEKPTQSNGVKISKNGQDSPSPFFSLARRIEEAARKAQCDAWDRKKDKKK